MAVERLSGGSSLIDVLDRVLDKGIVIDAWVRISLVGIDLITVEARIVVASIDTYLKYADEGLRAICVASRDNKPIGDKMIMNAAFLIERERETEFDAAVNRIAKKFGDPLNFKYTGPWPPYNFVNIRLKLEPSSSE
jgi:hypothetical protein